MDGSAPAGWTPRRRNGARGERLAAAHLADRGWTILAANVRAGRDEVDLVALEPGPVATLVFMEVRSHTTARFGAPEESVIAAKVGRTYRAAFALLRGGCLPDGTPLPRLPWRVDLIAVEMGPAVGTAARQPRIRHLQGLGPP